uniref:PNPLA domain-containing protein n=1 Tax=viral metagenome TaxID=1070528 RepID=A0A6C0AZZ7_9ZZZZ
MIKNIVFSGGGFKAWAYIGSLQAINEYKYLFNNVEQIIGVSAGAVFGLFYILDIKWQFLLDFFMGLNFKELFDIDIDNIFIQQSLLAGLKFTEIIREIMNYYIDPDVTFKQLWKFSKIKFTTSALNITDSQLEYFNYELTPDIKVIDAIRASCSLPIVLPPYLINGKYYYDGGICNNCPIDLVDEIESIAFDVAFYPENNNSSMKLVDLLNCMVTISNKSSKQKSGTDNVYSILDDSFNHESVNLNQSRDDIFNIYMNGYINSKNIMFKNHIALPGF